MTHIELISVCHFKKKLFIMIIAKHSENNTILIFESIEDALKKGFNEARIKESIKKGITHMGYYWV